VCYFQTTNLSPEEVLNPDQKQTVDYYVVVTIVLQWLRFFALFLLLKSVSKMIITLVDMFLMSFTFMIILFSYLILMASLFTTLYGSADPRYAQFIISIRTLFDVMMGNVITNGLSKYFISHSSLLALHIFISSILLLNFFIACLGKIYEEAMKTTGEFAFLANKY
jgi:hypothetical protein